MNTKAIMNTCEELKEVKIKVQVKKNEENGKRNPHVKLQRGEDAGGYSKKWPLQLYSISNMQ